jgi:hypothetical protein
MNQMHARDSPKPTRRGGLLSCALNLCRKTDVSIDRLAQDDPSYLLSSVGPDGADYKPSPGIYIQTSINYGDIYNTIGMNQMHARDSPKLNLCRKTDVSIDRLAQDDPSYLLSSVGPDGAD